MDVSGLNVLNRKLEVYHYTSPEGLMSILDEMTLRFSDCQFFNDTSEYTFINTPLEHALKRVKLKNPDLVYETDSWLDDQYEYPTADNKGMARYYVFCMSLDPDSLHMWNYYVKGKSYQGYNIGLSSDQITDYLGKLKIDNLDFMCGPVHYEPEEQISLILDLLEQEDAILSLRRKRIREKGIESDEPFRRAKDNIDEELERFRLFFKDRAFRDEHEFRFVLKVPVDFEGNDLLIRGTSVKNGVIAPHIDLKIKSEFIRSVTVSPMMDADLAKTGVELFAERKGYRSFEIKKSKIPIRY